ncbi:hypothetical protein MMC28_003804 [Mycoblastus sanguinarius]|nr:hypothetical protein [Mycoblastus sanguinarius]
MRYSTLQPLLLIAGLFLVGTSAAPGQLDAVKRASDSFVGDEFHRKGFSSVSPSAFASFAPTATFKLQERQGSETGAASTPEGSGGIGGGMPPWMEGASNKMKGKGGPPSKFFGGAGQSGSGAMPQETGSSTPSSTSDTSDTTETTEDSTDSTLVTSAAAASGTSTS